MTLSKANNQTDAPSFLDTNGMQGRRSRAGQARLIKENAEAEIAGYIAQMCAEMMAMAAKSRLDLLSYLLSIARTEADVISRRGNGANPPDHLAL